MPQKLYSLGLLVTSMAACARTGTAERPVRPGIEVLLTDSVHLVRGRRLGILTNQTGVDHTGTGDIELLRAAGLNLTAIFSPEHGFRGNLNRENIENAVDSATGVPIFSLYGATRAPSAEMLAGIDVLLVDLQDIGARPYTYVSTTLLALRAAREHRRPVIVLDRPNPIGGDQVQGPTLDTAFSSFVGMLPVPLRHGLTLGELARLGNERLEIGADLTVVPADGWRRGQWFDQTGLRWVRPSPSMPDLGSATHYPGLVLFEGTNLSVGRGTPIAFQVLAAPWLDPRRVRARVGATPGVVLRDTVITPVSPSDGKYPDRALPAIRLVVTSRGLYDPTRLAVQLLSALQAVHRDAVRIDARVFDQRVGDDHLRRALARGMLPDSIWADWRAPLEKFRSARERYLLYGP